MSEMLSICDRLGFDVDADQAVEAEAAARIREVVTLNGPRAALGKRPVAYITRSNSRADPSEPCATMPPADFSRLATSTAQ